MLQIVLIGAAAGGGILFLILVIVVFVVVIRRKKSKSGSKELTFVNPTAYTGKDGRVSTIVILVCTDVCYSPAM